MKSRASTIATLAVLALVMAMTDAQAGIAGSVAVTSDYVFRGVSQTNREPALQGGIEFAPASGSGFYAGAWGSNVSWLSDLSAVGAPVSNSVELDAYAGYRGKLGQRVSYDVGALYYAYPGDYPSGFNSPDTGEVLVGATVSLTDTASLGAKYSHAITDLFGFADSDGSGYLDLSLNWQFVPGWTLNVHGGKQWIENNADFAYADWKVGVSKAFDNGISLTAAYSDTDADPALYRNAYGNDIADSAFTLTASKAF
ncbi:TorF family putative porin [Montanilutibacter psychrotolerans]|uniref:Uncharacterized protein n=1 Tax=Montanilutibacter psychrotolerans TaxID=1327343 RepID=A0A3M8SYH9_9GAMM|nr:TorF family putative porin [Lysobacter psychrotolerans]RNF83612.1 hypothetical protein EER27_09480 [Lysobacter psychrotolerans]